MLLFLIPCATLTPLLTSIISVVLIALSVVLIALSVVLIALSVVLIALSVILNEVKDLFVGFDHKILRFAQNDT